MINWDKFRENIRKVDPYIPGEQPQYADKVKLNTNENPYPPSPKVMAELSAAYEEALRLYPDPNAKALKEALAEHYGVDPDQIFVGVGSDEVLALSFLTFFNSGRPILFPDITYSFYPVWADVFGIPYEKVPVRRDGTFAICPEDYKRENGGIIFPNPNAPTSRLESLETVEKIVAANPDVAVIVDEAYIDFAGDAENKSPSSDLRDNVENNYPGSDERSDAGAEMNPHSALSLLSKYDNLLVVQTFSKSRAMAGVRIGFAIGSRELIRCLNDVKNSFNSYTLNSLSIRMGAAAVKDEAYYRETIHKIKKTRQAAAASFRELGFTFPEPSANFLFVRHPEISAKDLFTYLRDRNIFVRYFDKPMLSDYLRVTVGTDEEMEKLFAAIREFMYL